MPSRSRLRGPVGKAQEFNLSLVLAIRTLALHSVDLQKHVCMRAHSCRKTCHRPSSYQNVLETCPLLNDPYPESALARAGSGCGTSIGVRTRGKPVTSPPAASLPPAAEKPSIRQAGSAVA